MTCQRKIRDRSLNWKWTVKLISYIKCSSIFYLKLNFFMKGNYGCHFSKRCYDILSLVNNVGK